MRAEIVFICIFLLPLAGCFQLAPEGDAVAVTGVLDVYAYTQEDGRQEAMYGKKQVHFEWYRMQGDMILKTGYNDKYPNSDGFCSFPVPTELNEGQHLRLCVRRIASEDPICEEIKFSEVRDAERTDTGRVIIKKELKVLYR